MTNGRTIDRIYNNTFEEIDAIIFEIKKKKNRASYAKYDFRFFFQSALICPILTHFEKICALAWSQI